MVWGGGRGGKMSNGEDGEDRGKTTWGETSWG